MKKWKELIAIITIILIFGNVTSSVAVADTQQNTNSVTVNDVLGVWEGYYLGSNGSTMIKRGYTLNIVSCDDQNSVYGVASVKPYGTSSSDTVHYYFEGSFDPATMTLKFCGTNIIVGTAEISMSEFTAVLDTAKQELNGYMTDDKERTLYLSKVNADNKITKEILEDSWTGYYMGNRGGKKVKRIITFDIKKVNSDNTLSGIAKVEGIPDEIDQVELKYNFSGFYNLTTGQVIIRGTDFISDNSYTPNFEFAYFFGTVNPESGEIAGLDGLADTYPTLTDVKFNVYNDIYVMDNGTSFTKNNGNYKVLTNGDIKTAAYIGPKDKSATGISIPSAVTAFGVTYKVTQIAKSAIKDCTELKKIAIGDNISEIKDNAFYQCSSLKSITFRTKALEKIGEDAFCGIDDSAVINVPKDKYNSYCKLLKKTSIGYKETWKIRKK